MKPPRSNVLLAGMLLATGAAPARAQDREAPDAVMQAMIAELERALDGLALPGVPKPYLIQLRAEDMRGWQISANYGAVVGEQTLERRRLATRVRVGSYEMDNTNAGPAIGWGANLPIEDDVLALREAIWLALDTDYKKAVEMYTRKEAYLKSKQEDEERPPDYLPAEPVVLLEPTRPLPADRAAWRDRLAEISARFRRHPRILDADARMICATGTRIIVNSEGTRLRTADAGLILTIGAKIQADDGMYIFDALHYYAEHEADIPPMPRILTDVDTLCAQLMATADAEVPDQYSGPVLFEGPAAGAVFASMLSGGLAARPVPVGTSRPPEADLEKKIGRRVLPRSFNMYDDPRQRRLGDTLLVGAQDYDDEAVAAQRVDLVQKGILQTLVASRAPTRRIRQTTGHAGSTGFFTDPQARVACLFVEDEDGLGEEQLRRELIDAAGEEGLEYGIRVAAMEPGAGDLGDPIRAYKVYVADGREEPLRGMEFLPVQVRALKRIIAGGNQPAVYNSIDSGSYTIVAPAILFEELELAHVEREEDRPPYLPSPALREPETAGGAPDAGVEPKPADRTTDEP
jgi:hypothetical protein